MMGVSAREHIQPISVPVPEVGYATRFKRWPNRCACSGAEGRKVRAASAPPHLVDTQAGQQALDAAGVVVRADRRCGSPTDMPAAGRDAG